MYLFVYQSYNGNKTDDFNTEKLLHFALNQYLVASNLPEMKQPETKLIRSPKGKPYFQTIPIQFSVSHSEQLWVCLMGTTQNGVDVQKISNQRFEAIAKRFFQPEEQEAVAQGGLAAFMKIWCRKEAFIKYFGLTIGETIDWLNVAESGKPVDDISHQGERIIFTELPVNSGFQCVAATNEKEPIWIRELIIS